MGNLISCNEIQYNPQEMMSKIRYYNDENFLSNKIDLTKDDFEYLQKAIGQGKDIQISLNNANAQLFLAQPQMQQNLRTKPGKIVMFNKIINENEQSEKTGYNGQKQAEVREGLIVYDKGFYHGQIKNNCANGSGVFYLPFQINYVIKGKWVNDSIKQVDIFKQNQYEERIIFSLKIENERKGKITVQNNFTYYGDIKLDGINKFQQIMSGKGIIHYENRDQYDGTVKNGLMHTENEVGTYKYYSGVPYIQYKGPFKHGKKEGFGTVMLMDNGQLLTMKMKFEDNLPKGNGSIIRNEIGQSFQLQKQEQFRVHY